MTQLFDRITRVTINERPGSGGRVIESSNTKIQDDALGLDVDVIHTSTLNGFPVATVIIWNPSDKTIGECQSTRDNNDEIVFPKINVEMGYIGAEKGIINGAITAFNVDRISTGRSLTITASEREIFKPVVTQKSFVGKRADYLFLVLASGFVTNINPGENVLIPKMVVRDVLGAIRQVVALSKSSFYVSAGKINIIPATLIPNRPTIVDFNSGLLESPVKIESANKKEKGYLIKALPLPGIRAGSSIKAIWHRNEKEKFIEGVIYHSKITFPSRGEALAEYKVAA